LHAATILRRLGRSAHIPAKAATKTGTLMPALLATPLARRAAAPADAMMIQAG